MYCIDLIVPQKSCDTNNSGLNELKAVSLRTITENNTRKKKLVWSKVIVFLNPTTFPFFAYVLWTTWRIHF